MDIKLPEAELRWWARHVSRYFNNLQEIGEGFAPAIFHDPLFEGMSAKDDEGKLQLKKLRTAADVLHAVQCCIGLATKKSSLSEISKLKESLEGIMPSREKHEEGPATTLDPIYSVVQLDDTKTQIRLIKLLPGQPQDPIKIELITVQSVRSQPYEALSYVWGSPDANVIIEVNGKPFEIAANLHDALSCLRQLEDERVLWVDAICINQVHDLEKSSQVSMMGDIYRNAADVIIFLGREKDGSAMIMQYLDLEDVEEADFGPLELETTDLTSTRGKWQKETERDLKDARLIQARIQKCGFDSIHFLEAADAFLKRPWWYRIWTVQEYALAQTEPRWYCGRTWTSTGQLRDKIGQLKTYLTRQSRPLVGDLAVFTSAQIDIGREFIKIGERSWTINMQLTERNPLADWAPPSHFLLRLAYRQSTDPRDRIYALREMLDPVSKQVFVPDYSASADDVFMKLTTYVLCHDKFGHIYAYYEASRSPDLPSWVLDFTKPFSLHGISHLSWYMKERASAPRTPLDRMEIKALWSKNISRLSIYNRVLSVMGVEIDIIDHTAYLERETDIRRLGLVWKLEGIIQKYHPSRTLPESAKPFLPGSCLIPFPPPLREHFSSLGSELVGLQFPATAKIPGYIHVWVEMMKLQCNLAPLTTPENLTCKNWERAAFSRSWELRYGTLCRLYGAFYEAFIAETFLGGACFDFPNLKNQIMSVNLPERNPLEPNKDMESTDAKASGDHNAVVPDNGNYVPQYSHIKNILLQCRSKEELAILQKAAIGIAELCCSIVSLHLAKQGPPGTQLIAEFKATFMNYFTTQLSAYRSIFEKCTCEGDIKDKHQTLLKEKIAAAENDLSKAEAKLEYFVNFKVEGIQQSNELEQTVTRQYTSMFVTNLGLFGASFQPEAGFKNGGKVVVLDGIPAPMILEKVDGLTYKLRGVAHIVGITHIDIEKLVEVGVFERKQFHIV
ncbi:HET-domain-containing protein [Stipitochalara longipes BDJ]|nr:HET-domain-containing protein [Stipitochalara longipes BDJ]